MRSTNTPGLPLLERFRPDSPQKLFFICLIQKSFKGQVGFRQRHVLDDAGNFFYQLGVFEPRRILSRLVPFGPELRIIVFYGRYPLRATEVRWPSSVGNACPVRIVQLPEKSCTQPSRLSTLLERL